VRAGLSLRLAGHVMRKRVPVAGPKTLLNESVVEGIFGLFRDPPEFIDARPQPGAP
jgi:hypothetical protein